MKSDTMNGILTFVLGALAVVGAYLAINIAFVTRETRTLTARAVNSKVQLARAEGVFGDAQAYYQKYPSPELAHILQLVEKPKPASH